MIMMLTITMICNGGDSDGNYGGDGRAGGDGGGCDDDGDSGGNGKL